MPRSRFANYAWCVLAFNVLIILWGAYVRASGSGAGCGSHWPLCNGEVLPRAPAVETLVELTHRITSGVGLLLVLGLFVWAMWAFPRGDLRRLGATLSLVLMVMEALIGAGLVLFSLVADNATIGRALFMAVHLANTFLLLAALALTAWWASGGAPPVVAGRGRVAALLGVAAAGTLLIGVSGAVAALGDTLFPARSLAEGLRADFSPAAHLLVRLRLLHPAIAIGAGLYLMVLAAWVRSRDPRPVVRQFATAVIVLVALQLAAGAINVALLAPIWMQLVHLLLADALWIGLVLLAAVVLSPAGARAASGGVERVVEDRQRAVARRPAER